MLTMIIFLEIHFSDNCMSSAFPRGFEVRETHDKERLNK